MRMPACRHDFAFEIEVNMMEIFSEYSQNCGNAKHEAVLILKMYTYLFKASFTIISQSSSYDIPTASASCGTRLVGVMPGSVFTSRK